METTYVKTVPKRMEIIYGVDPSAGNEVVYNTPQIEWWELYFFRLKLTTSANGTNRQISLKITDKNGFTMCYIPYATGIIGPINPGTTTEIVYCSGHYDMTISSGNIRIVPFFPKNLILPPYSQIRTITDNIDSSDNYDAPVFYVRRY